MKGWSTHEGLAVALPQENIDTDQLIPARFMTASRADGYGGFLLHDLRHDHDGAPHPEHPLNSSPDASILVSRRNFGSGSSREAAVYALVDAGFKAVVAPSFGDIFANNAINNGLLPALVSEADAERLIAALNEPLSLTVDLAAKHLSGPDLDIAFELDTVRQRKLIKGWDDIDLTLSETERIAAFKAKRQKAAPWVWPGAPG